MESKGLLMDNYTLFHLGKVKNKGIENCSNLFVLNNSSSLVSVKDILDGTYVHPHWLQFPSISPPVHIVFGVVATILSLLSSIGNIIIISLFIRYRSLRRCTCNSLILNLSIADLLLTLGNLPMFAVASFKQGWIFEEIGCQIYGYVGAMASLVSINTLTLIAVERAIVIHQLPSNGRLSFKTMKIIVGFLWIYSTFWATMPLIGWGRYIIDGSLVSCTFDFLSQDFRYKSFVIALQSCCFYLQLSLIVISYTSIYLKVAVNEREIRKCTKESFSLQRPSTKLKHQNRELMTVKISLGIILVFCLSWLPYAIVSMIGCFGNRNLITPLASAIPGICAKCATAVNPVIYALMHPKYLTKIKKDVKTFNSIIE